jgi:acyl-CoA thioesterase FadM
MTTSATAVRTEVVARPRFEGSNINTWIGFKHVMYLVEEAVLDHLRQRGLVPRALYEEHGLGTEIVDSDARILTALHMDDLVRTEVVEQPGDGSGELLFRTVSWVDRPELGPDPVKAVTAKVRVLLRRDPDVGEPPAELAPYTVERIDRGGASVTGGPDDATGDLAAARGVTGVDGPPRDANSFVWRWRIPYFYCHFNNRLQHSGYLRLMEEVVDLFLADRGISIWDMLGGQQWIPVVPQARVEILREALMEEELYIVFNVEEVFKTLTYTARMDCYVQRDGEFVQTATGRITHGYATVLNRRDWAVVPFDERTMAALHGAADGRAASHGAPAGSGERP